jgi:HK97 gp10 family phage protein
MMDAQLQREVNEAVRKLYRVANHAKKETNGAFRKASPILINAIKQLAPVSDEPHSRYKGETKITYYPGNLRRSFRNLTFRRSPAVWVGPKVDKSGTGIEYKGNKVDGYYAHFVEFGTENQRPHPFVRPAAQTAGPETLRRAIQELKKQIDSYAQSISV